MASYTLHIQYPDRPAETRSFDQPTITIGREVGDIAMHDSQVSGRHAEIKLENGKLIYTDLGSTNGSFRADGQRIFSPTALQIGQSIKLGQSQVTVQSIEGAQQAVPEYPGGGDTLRKPKGTVLAGPGSIPPPPPAAPGPAMPGASGPPGRPPPPAGAAPPQPSGPPSPPAGPASQPPSSQPPPPGPGGPAAGSPQMPSAMAGAGRLPPPPGGAPGSGPAQTGQPPDPAAPGAAAPMGTPAAPQPPGAEAQPPAQPPPPEPPPSGGGMGEQFDRAERQLQGQLDQVGGALDRMAAQRPASDDLGGQVKYYLSWAGSSYKARFVQGVTITAVVAVPLAVLGLIPVVGWVLALLIAVALMPLASVAVGRWAVATVGGRSIDWRQAWRATLASAVPDWLNLFVAVLLAGLGLLLLIVPGILLGAFVLPIYLLEDKKFVDINVRNLDLAKQDIGRVLAVVFAGILVAIPVWIAIGAVELVPIVGSIFGSLLSATVTPFFMLVATKLYVDLRQDLEQVDVLPEAQRRAQAWAGPGALAAASAPAPETMGAEPQTGHSPAAPQQAYSGPQPAAEPPHPGVGEGYGAAQQPPLGGGPTPPGGAAASPPGAQPPPPPGGQPPPPGAQPPPPPGAPSPPPPGAPSPPPPPGAQPPPPPGGAQPASPAAPEEGQARPTPPGRLPPPPGRR